MPAASPYEVVATALKTIIDTEFAPEGFTAIHDNLHESLGRERVAIGIAPVEDEVTDRNNVVQETLLEVKFYLVWKPEISPETQVNPFQIAEYAQRFRDACRQARNATPGTDMMWFYDVQRVQYPNDPTGNKTRFVATVRALGNNAGLVETVG
jgi:hypothetical protein